MTDKLSLKPLLALILAAIMLAGCSPTTMDGESSQDTDETGEKLPERDLIEDPPDP